VMVMVVMYNVLAVNDVIVDQLRLYVDGEEYFIKGMCYNPAPLGQECMNADQTGGGGYCSTKETAYGEYKSACYDSDYFDGSSDAPGRVPAGPSDGGWFQPVWERDFPYMQAMGVNTIRIYNANPTTRQATVDYPNLFQYPYGKDHIQFLDLAVSYNFKVIFPLLGDYSLLESLSAEQYDTYLQYQIDEVGNHTAIIMWTLGNELPLSSSNPDLTDYLNQRIAFARNYTLQRWNRKLPITSAVVDDPSSYNYLVTALDVDVFTPNAGYRGPTFTDLWSGDIYTYGMYNLSCSTGKPIFIGEIGWRSENNSIMSTFPNWFNENWQDLTAHIDQGCIGGAFFEYNDEPMKVDPMQQTMGSVKFSISYSNGANSTAANAWMADELEVKLYFYVIANGTYNGVQYNMNADPFSLIGRSPYTLGCSPGICSPYGIDLQSQYTCQIPSSSPTSVSISTTAAVSTAASSVSTAATSAATSATSAASTLSTSAASASNSATSSNPSTIPVSSSTGFTSAASTAASALTSASSTVSTFSTSIAASATSISTEGSTSTTAGKPFSKASRLSPLNCMVGIAIGFILWLF